MAGEPDARHQLPRARRRAGRPTSSDRKGYETTSAAEPAHVSKLEDGSGLEFVSCRARPFPSHDVGAFDDQGRRPARPPAGELWVERPSIARGYYLDPEATRKTFGGGWLRTGDLGYLVNGKRLHHGPQEGFLIYLNGRNYDPQRLE